MSMIHGVVSFDGGHPGAEFLGPMLEAGRAACPDGAETWCDGTVALGLGLLRTLPRARTARGPLRDPESGLVLVADARIDNRPELLEKLGLGGDRELTDAGLILHAYREWRGRCVERLIGDFAFAVWDGAERTLFCARDPFGVCPFYFFRGPDGFVFSSALSALLAVDIVPQDLDGGAIADTLAGLILEEGRTLYREISVLPAAHCMTVRDGQAAARQYWRPEANGPIRLAGDGEYAEAYRELLEQAVACRLDSDGKVSGLLSGGLDSGAIAAMAGPMLAEKGRRLAAYSFVLAEAQRPYAQDERDLIGLIHEMPGIDGHFITTGDFSGSVAELYGDSPWCLPGGNSPYLATLFRRMGDEGSRVLLDGLGGDNCATCERSVPLQEFLGGLQVARLKRYLAAASRRGGKSQVRTLLGMLRGHSRGRAAGIGNQLFERSLLSPDLRGRVDMVARARRNLRFRPGQYRSLQEVMIHRLSQIGRAFDAMPVFPGNGVERRFPLLDKRLVEFCLSVPAEQHSFDVNRRLMRRAMAGRLPDPIRLRHNKDISNSPGMPFFLRENREWFIAAIDAARGEADIAAFIDVDGLRRRFSRVLPASYVDFMPGPTMRAFHMLRFLRTRRVVHPHDFAKIYD